MNIRQRYVVACSIGASAVALLTTLSATATSASTSGTASPVGTTVACSTAIAPAPLLGHVETHFAYGLLTPFGVAFGPDGDHAFVDSLINPTRSSSGPAPTRDASGLSEFSVTASGLVSERVGSFADESLLGMAISPNGRDLVAASGSGASVFSVPRIDRPNSPPSSWLLGSFSSRGQGAIEVAVSPDGHDVFVSLEDSNQLAVFNLQKAERDGFGSSDLVGYVPMGAAPVGMAISPNGRYLYATSEVAAGTGTGTEGTLSTIDLRRAETQPSRSVVSTVWAGCSPVRVVATSSSVYVTARESDELLEFSATDLTSQPASALIGQVEVGEAPVGLALANHDGTVMVADSNRFGANGATSNLAVVRAAKTSLQLVGYVPAGDFPRDMAISPDGTTIVLSDYGSGQVEEVDVGTLP